MWRFLLCALLWSGTLSAQNRDVGGFTVGKLDGCTPAAQLHGKDTIWKYVPCRRLDVLEPHFRAQIECTFERMMQIGGWQRPLVAETYRSDELQRIYYARGRTTPGPRVTNAKNGVLTVHYYGYAVDVVHATLQWDAPTKFWRSLTLHAEFCGLTAGAAWKKFPDRPHLQTGMWEGAPPVLARAQITKIPRDSFWLSYPVTPYVDSIYRTRRR